MIEWAKKLGRPDCPYLVRWKLDFGWFSIRLHHWLASDDYRAQHDHPSWFWTLVVWGGYTDVTPKGEEKMRAGKLAFRPATHRHHVRVDKGGCWTLLLFGREKRRWGFWVNGKFRKRNKYFFEHGYHPCENGT